MSSTNTNYVQGGFLQTLVADELVNNRWADGIVLQGQNDLALIKCIERSNAKYEKAGMGNQMITSYESRIAYMGDMTVKAQVSSASAVTGGVKIVFSDSNYIGFRPNDNVDLRWNGNKAKVIEAGAGYIVVAQRDGFTAPVYTDYVAGDLVIARDRNVDMRGTTGPNGINPIPQLRKNWLSIVDDGNQTNIVDSMINTNIRNAEGFLRNGALEAMVTRHFKYMQAQMFTSRGVNPESNGMSYMATKGIIEQIQDGGAYYQFSSLITKADFEAKVRSWLLSNPANSMQNRIIKTGAMGMGLLSTWYQDLLKYDAPIAVTFTDGTVSGLNATKVYIPGWVEPIQVVHDITQDMDMMGARSSASGYTDLPKSSGDWYFLDFSPVNMASYGTAPAFQKYYLRHKFFVAMEQGLIPADITMASSSGYALTESNFNLTSTTNDFSKSRIYQICGINVMNESAHVYIQNNY